MALESDIDIIGLPLDGSGRYEFVQLVLDGKPIMVCGTRFSDHAAILEDYLSASRVNHSMRNVPNPSDKIPNAEGERYKVAGMGTIHINPSEREMKLSGLSAIYELEPSPDFSSRMAVQMPGWKVRQALY